MNLKIKVLSLLSLFLIGATMVTRIKEYKLTKIVIDPGHGGRDSGCCGNGCKEKDIALEVALKLGDKIKNTFPNIQVIYTRSKDISLGLRERLDIIRKCKPGLTISIHCNGSKDKNVSGFEIYFRGKEAYWPTFKIKANLDYYSLKAVERENRVILMEKNYKEKYKEFKNNSIYSKIAAQNYNNAYLKNSIKFANKIVQKLKSKCIKCRGLGVFEGNFIMLCKASFTTIVLTELGYLTNPKEAKFLVSKEGQNTYVDCLFKAIKEYKEELEKNS